jgi:hypothetical protein
MVFLQGIPASIGCDYGVPASIGCDYGVPAI